MESHAKFMTGVSLPGDGASKTDIESEHIHKRDAAFSPVVIVPTYNHASQLMGVLARLDSLLLPIIVVNDGSTDNTARITADWRKAAGGSRVKIVVEHPSNRGKAAAIQTGFAAARKAHYTHAVTIDSDGQLDPGQIPELLAVAEKYPEALVLGVRERRIDGCPRKSTWGRSISNFLIRMECGARIEDSQCGLRVYPLGVLAGLKCRASGYHFETEVITLAVWSGCRTVEVPVRCKYFPAGTRVSHFRPFVDSLRSLRMHAGLLTAAVRRVIRGGP